MENCRARFVSRISSVKPTVCTVKYWIILYGMTLMNCFLPVIPLTSTLIILLFGRLLIPDCHVAVHCQQTEKTVSLDRNVVVRMDVKIGLLDNRLTIV